MPWKWYRIESYKASVGGKKYYGGIQLFAKDFYAHIRFHKSGTLPDSTAPTTYGQRFYGHMDYQQMDETVDILRNEDPVWLGWFDGDPNFFHLMTGKEPVGEGDGALADDTP